MLETPQIVLLTDSITAFKAFSGWKLSRCLAVYPSVLVSGPDGPFSSRLAEISGVD